MSEICGFLKYDRVIKMGLTRVLGTSLDTIFSKNHFWDEFLQELLADFCC